MKTQEQIRAELLQPFFEIVGKILCETSILIDVSVLSFKTHKTIHWNATYSNRTEPAFEGSTEINDEFSEDLIVDWVIKLQGMYDEYMGIDEGDYDDESEADIAAYENHRIDSQERAA